MAEFQLPIKSHSVLALWFYYGAKTVGTVFFVGGLCFLVAVCCRLMMGEGIEAEERKFLTLFAVMSACFAGGGALMLLASLFMKKPEIPENDPKALDELRCTAQTVRWISVIGMLMTATSILPLAAMFFFLADMRDWRSWEDVPETGTCVSCKDSHVISDDAPLQWCHFRVKTPEGEEITWESYSPKAYSETDVIPLQRSGSLYRARGCQFGVVSLEGGAVMGTMLFVFLFFFVVCLRGFLKLSRFLKKEKSKSEVVSI